MLQDDAARLGVKEPSAVDGRPADQERHAEGPHPSVLGVELHQVADAFGDALYRRQLVERQPVALRVNPGAVHKDPRVGNETRCGRTYVEVDLEELLRVRRCLKLAVGPLLDREHDALVDPYADRSGPGLHRLQRVLDLVEPALGREHSYGPVIGTCHAERCHPDPPPSRGPNPAIYVCRTVLQR
jgi:hypothetical protein